MAEKQSLITEEGLQKLKQELDQLVTEKRPEIVERIKVARSHGDLSENSEYDAAKEEQAFIESRIMHLENTIRNAKVIDVTQEDGDVVTVGKTVVFEEVPDGDQEVYTIVGSTESDPLQGKISNDSPLGKGLIGHKVGDQVTIQTPGGEMKVKIIEVRIDV